MAAALAQGEGGFDANFVEPVADRLTCPICHLALQEPRLTQCGHQFCFGCLSPSLYIGMQLYGALFAGQN